MHNLTHQSKLIEIWRTVLFVAFFFLIAVQEGLAQEPQKAVINVPKLIEEAVLTYAPQVPPSITRKQPALVKIHLNSSRKIEEIKPGFKYEYWTFNERVPGPFIRVREGDTIEVRHTSSDTTGMPHNIDFHAVTGPGGGAPVTTVVQGEERITWFKMLSPGLYIYHCAAPPVMDHIANGMYGLILVEPKKGLPKVDREFYVMQHEVYAENPSATPATRPTGDSTNATEKQEEANQKDSYWGEEGEGSAEPILLKFSHQNGLDEHPMFVFLNGKFGSLLGAGALKAKVGEKVRIYYGNIGPNLISSFHVIGEIFDNVYREGDLTSPPGHNIQSTLVPAGGATAVEFKLEVPGTFTLVDHAIFRVEKGCVGYLEVEGEPNYDIYASDQDPVICPGCLVHP